MPFRLARMIRAHLAAVVAKSTCHRAARASTARPVEALEDRRLLTVSIVTPFHNDVEGLTAAFYADFTATARPVAATVDWADGTVEHLEQTMMDYSASSWTGRSRTTRPSSAVFRFCFQDILCRARSRRAHFRD